MSYAFAAAGTGGHVYPALSVAAALRDAGIGATRIVFFGGDRLEARAVPAAGFEFVQLDVRGLRRSLSVRNLTLPLVMVSAARRMADELRRRDVDVVTAFGSYVAVPAAWASRRAGATLFAQEQNAIPGLANRLISRWAEATFVAFPKAAERLRRAAVVGNPLRPGLASFHRERLRPMARERYGVTGTGPVLGVLGGSLGAQVLNDTAQRFVAETSNGGEVIHLTGPNNLDAVERRAASHSSWHVIGYEERMEFFYAASDLVLSRAGALTVSELAATATPAVVVPRAAETSGHQSANAAELAAAGGCVVVPEAALGSIPRLLADLLADATARAEMARGARSVGKPNAAAVIAGRLMEAAGD